MKTWFYLDKQNQEKNALESQLPGLVRQEALDEDTLIWTDGMGEWTKAGDALPELFLDEDEALAATAPPPLPAGVIVGPTPGQRCHEVDYEIFGDDMQIVEVELDPGESVVAEAGARSGAFLTR